jgi:hypothetical protein
MSPVNKIYRSLKFCSSNKFQEDALATEEKNRRSNKFTLAASKPVIGSILTYTKILYNTHSKF